MNDAVLPNETGMAALIGKSSEYVEQIISDNNLNLEVANDNSPMQVVISGFKIELIEIISKFLEILLIKPLKTLPGPKV